jgi:hypothetical protein
MRIIIIIIIIIIMDIRIILKNFCWRTSQVKDSIAWKTKTKFGKGRGGQTLRKLDEKLSDNEHSYRWLNLEDIKGETESTIVAAQDQAISKSPLKIKFWRKKLTVNAGYEESIDHLN